MAYDATLKRLPDPTTTPEGPGFIAQTLTNNSPGMVHDLNSGDSIAVKFQGDFWTINLSYPELNIAEGSTIFPFLYSLQGSFENLYVQLPTMSQPATGAWDISTISKIAQGEITLLNSKQISIPAWSTRGGDLSVGDMLKFDNFNKIFMIVGRSIVADTITLTINSEIPDASKIASAGLEPNDIKFRVRVKGKVPDATLTAEGLYGSFSISFKENNI